MSPAEVCAKSAAIRQQLIAVPGFVTAEWVLCFVSFGAEVETHALIRQLLVTGRRVCVPWFDPATRHYACSEVNDLDGDLTAGKMKILEPKPEALRPVMADRVDVWLVPGLAFEKRGHRLGRGKGYFDALLHGARGIKIALAYEFQLLKEVPVEDHDVTVDFIVTENQIVKCVKD